MTRSPDEALHFRGKTLTPESPRPLHIPEPANIPVLENQMDPVFNDTSTYERSEYQAPQTEDDRWSRVLPKDGQEPGQQVRDSGSFQGSQPMDRASHNDMTVSADFISGPASGDSSGDANRLAPPNPHGSHAPPVAPVTQNATEIENASNEQSGGSGRLDIEKDDPGSNTGVNFQTLLDNLSHHPTASTSATAAGPNLAENSSFHQAPPDESLQPQGLPNRPLPQDPSLPPYAPLDGGYELPPAPDSSAAPIPSTYTPTPSNHQSFAPSLPSAAPGTATGASSLPPPPVASFQHTAESQSSSQEPPNQTASNKGRVEKQARPVKGTDDDSPWAPEVQRKYDEFLHNERIYVTEGLWDRFPMGSRLFVGNLPTERVTKRDMFHIFHQYGKLAQISIKQAYGFIQFLEAGSCHAALQAEQGALILKFRNPNAQPGPLRQSLFVPLHLVARGRRSLVVVAPPEAMFEHRVIVMTGRMSHPDCRSVISGTSPRFADATIIDLRDRLHPDLSVAEMGTDRGTGPQRDLIVGTEGVLVLLAPRAPRTLGTVGIAAQVPDPVVFTKGRQSYPCQDVPHEKCQKYRFSFWKKSTGWNFVLHVENAFRNRGLRVDVLVLGPRIPLGAAVHRQFVEGVLAVVRLSRPNQFSRKIPLQIFDRTAGPENVRFSDYPEVDPSIAAEVMFHQAQAMQRGGPPATFAPNPAFGVASVPALPVPQPALPGLTNPPNIANLISSLDGPSLQSLLSALQRPPQPQSQPVSATQSPFSSPNPPPPADLATLLTNATRPPPVSANPQPPLPPPFSLQPPAAPVVSDPNLLSLLAKGLGGQQPQGQAPGGPQVQNIMNHLAKWKQ
ncbi:hypothetical protein NUU61_004929 [Penicillium alfredii]|uniref:RRM domain-containing protein n=1 Tax=Penicillium alfredii TaxID=1506179 RepID=A0A9W9F8J7_9EURO|nr:uncharacterized protein NUU61_004929 [Penicillium alfredii]KAJ5095573.1 hypothetical protein NUU61_004929 [Penicillium alfredii]